VAVGDFGGFVVRTFGQSNPARRVRQPRHVVGRALEVGLQADADAAVVLVGERLVGANRRVRRRVILHVDPDERAGFGRHPDDPVEVVAEGVLADPEPEL
jgi:hypothetical protein